MLSSEPDHDRDPCLAGFDWLLLDAEHSPNDVLTLIPQLMALKDRPSAPVVRPPTNHAIILKRLLDAGFNNFLIPFVESPEEAQRAVPATRYPPAGIRGVSVAQRSNRYGNCPRADRGVPRRALSRERHANRQYGFEIVRRIFRSARWDGYLWEDPALACTGEPFWP